jgi:hypothetical protein
MRYLGLQVGQVKNTLGRGEIPQDRGFLFFAFFEE